MRIAELTPYAAYLLRDGSLLWYERIENGDAVMFEFAYNPVTNSTHRKYHYVSPNQIDRQAEI